MSEKTERNLALALAAESQASARDTTFAQKADQEAILPWPAFSGPWPNPSPFRPAGTCCSCAEKSAAAGKTWNPPSIVTSEPMKRNTLE